MKKTVGILAHVDAGKTTFAEQILYHTKSIKVRGRVDHKNSFLDSSDIEKQRGITVFSDQAVFNYNSSTYYLVDTPGHMDFSAEMERAVDVMDYAIIILSAVEGVQAQTETVWNILKNHKMPVFFFVNKTDRTGADIAKVMDEIKLNLAKDIFYISPSFNPDAIGDELIEFLAEHDDNLLSAYLKGDYENSTWLEATKLMIKENKIYPCMSGSALLDNGIQEFLKIFDLLTYTEYSEEGEFGGTIYKIRHDAQHGKIAYIKALSGSLNVKDSVKTKSSAKSLNDTEAYTYEKVNQIRIYNGTKFITTDKVSAGDLFAIPTLQNAVVGNGVGAYHKTNTYKMIPTLKSKLIFDPKLNPKDVLRYMRILEEEDPALNILWNEKFQQIEVHIMGIVQLEILKQLILERFNLNVDFGPCEILYKETIADISIGCGHFEPLRHYAEVHLKLEPNTRNAGIKFATECHVDDLALNYQNLIKSHIFEKEHNGILTGSPITDIKITLINGKSHIKHTNGGDFREATLRALRHGLEYNKNILLEPYYKFKIEVTQELLGKVISDIQKLNGTFEAPLTHSTNVIICGRGPVASFMNYSTSFASLTQGKGKLNFIFEGYDICHNQEEIIEKLNYNKNADSEYTSSSIFCSKGQSFSVEAKDAKAYMHCSND